MRFVIDIRPAGGGWEVHVLDAGGRAPVVDPQTGKPLTDPPRALRRLGVEEKDLLTFPLPPAEDVRRLDQTTAHYALCAATDPEIVSAAYRKIVGRNPIDGGVEVFGRYLFDTLLGRDLWDALKSVAGQGAPVELSLCWRDENTAVNRLNWEMMHDGAKFLGELPSVAITRRVVGDEAPGKDTLPSLELEAPPRVLFVVGTSLNTDVIRPGAEYLGLLRSLNAAKLRLRTRLLLQASVAKMEALMESYKPDVVHFICHGGYSFEDQQPYLELVDDERPTLVMQVKADNLRRVLCENQAGVRPSIVVLNACHSASTSDDFLRSGQVSSPLAVSLARYGVPVVVAMAGEVADHACRLFTRRFYETLLSGGNVALAAAQGRRAGIIMYGNDDPKNTVDWALPTLFFSDSLREAQLSLSKLSTFSDLESIAETYATPDTYPVFCGRLSLFWWYSILISDSKTQRQTSPDRNDFQYLALSVDEADKEGEELAEKPRYGRSWLLHELAGQAAREGHVPCFVDDRAAKDFTGDWPKSIRDVLYAIDAACDTLVDRFGLGAKASRYLSKVLQLQAGQPLPVDAPEDIAKWYKGAPEQPRFLARTLQYELTRLLDDVCRLRALARHDAQAEKTATVDELFAEEQAQTKLVLLIDDLHRMGKPAVEGLLNEMLGPDGLRTVGERVRVVMTYTSVPAQGQEPAVSVITEWVKRREVQIESLQAFNLADDLMAYKQFLLNWRDTNNKQGAPKPLTLRASAVNSKTAQFFFKKLHRAAKDGIPSFLAERQEVTEFIREVLVDWPELDNPIDILRPANDDVQLEQLAQGQQGGGQQP